MFLQWYTDDYERTRYVAELITILSLRAYSRDTGFLLQHPAFQATIVTSQQGSTRHCSIK